MTSLIDKRILWRCPAIYCTLVGEEGDICPKHNIKLVKAISNPNIPRFWSVAIKRKGDKSFK